MTREKLKMHDVSQEMFKKCCATHKPWHHIVLQQTDKPENLVLVVKTSSILQLTYREKK